MLMNRQLETLRRAISTALVTAVMGMNMSIGSHRYKAFALCALFALAFKTAACTSDGYYLPIQTVRAEYPEQARRDDVEGYCVVEYSVTFDGAIKQPSIHRCVPADYFEQVTLKAISQFKYEPRVVDGIPYEVKSVHYLFWFSRPKTKHHSSDFPPKNLRDDDYLKQRRMMAHMCGDSVDF